MEMNGQTIKNTTDSNGQITVPTNGIAAGTYDAIVKFEGNENYTEDERKAAIEALYKYPDLSPYELQAKYLDEFGIYLGSVRWLYYLLEDIKNRKPQIKGPKTKGPCNLSRQTCTATQVWKVLPGTKKARYSVVPRLAPICLFLIRTLLPIKLIMAHTTRSPERNP